jgi:hypothetical protein
VIYAVSLASSNKVTIEQEFFRKVQEHHVCSESNTVKFIQVTIYKCKEKMSWLRDKNQSSINVIKWTKIRYEGGLTSRGEMRITNYVTRST